MNSTGNTIGTPKRNDVGIAKRAFQDAPHCGDGGGAWVDDNKLVLCLLDGLGHGVHAEEAALAALDYIGRHFVKPLQQIVDGCSMAIRGTRGVSLALAAIDLDRGNFTYCGIGSMRALLRLDGTVVRLPSTNGIVGAGMRPLAPEQRILGPRDLVIFASDGIQEHLGVSGYDGKLLVEPQSLAEQILADFSHGRDDAAVLVFCHGIRS